MILLRLARALYPFIVFGYELIRAELKKARPKNG